MKRPGTRKWVFLLVSAGALMACELVEPAGEVAFPLESWQVLQEFGNWNPNWNGYHLAADVAAEAGTPVRAMASGMVRAVFINDEAAGYGALVLIEHDFEGAFVTSLHGHLSTQLGVPVAVGEVVARGDVIGYIAADDEDGGPWAPHLHFGIRRGPVDLDATLCGEWLYVGYTRDCPDTSHEEARDLWLDPTAFLVGRGAGP